MTKQKSKEKTIMDNMVQECKNSFQTIKSSSLSEESKKKLISVLVKERRKRFNEPDYQWILEKVGNEGKISPSDLYEILDRLSWDMDMTMEDFGEGGGNILVEIINDEIRKNFGEMVVKKLPKNMQDLKKTIIPFDISDDDFYHFILESNNNNKCIQYKGQRLHLGSNYEKLLREKEYLEEEITSRVRDKFNDKYFKNLEKEICIKERTILSCRVNNPSQLQNMSIIESTNSEIEKIQKEIEVRKQQILDEICQELGYDDIISKILQYEKSVFHERYPYLEKLYNDSIIKRQLHEKFY